jgi:hypothetical protein
MDVPNVRKRPFQFGIGTLFLTTTAVAVGFSIGCLKTARLEDGLFAAATTLIVIGLVRQIGDLRRTYRQADGLSPEQRCGWWFAMLSRGALAILLASHFLLMALLATGRIELANTGDDLPFFGPLGHAHLRNAIFSMSLLLVFAGLDGSTTRVRPRRASAVIALLTALAIVILIWHLLLYDFWIYGLVHVACCGIAMGMPHGPVEFAQIYSDARAWSFLCRSVLAGGLVLLDAFFLRQLISRWNGGKHTQAAIIAALGVSLALTAIFPVWLATGGLRSVAPCFAEVFSLVPVNRWFFGILLLILFVTAAARQMVPGGRMTAADTRWNWRRPAGYFHEHRLLALFVMGTIACLAVRSLVTTWNSWIIWWAPRPTFMEFAKEVLEYSLANPFHQLWAVVFWLALCRTIFGFARNAETAGARPPELRLSLFAIVWTALLATVVMTAPIFAALGFGLCLNWWRLPF